MIAYKMTGSIIDHREFADHCEYCGYELDLIVLPIDSATAYIVVEDESQMDAVRDMEFCHIDYEKVKEV